MRSIGYIYQDQYPWDIRVDKITQSLADAGYETVIISRNRDGIVREESLGPRLRVIRLPGPSFAPLRSLLNIPAFFSPMWLYTIYRVVKRRNIELLIVRDLPLAPAAWCVARLCRIPVVMDMAENYPAMIQDTWDHRGADRFDFLLRNPRMLRALERWIVPRLDGVMTVSSASNDRVAAMTGQVSDRVCVIENVPRLASAGQSTHSELSERMKKMDVLKLLYVGGLEESRGLMIAVQALHHYIRSGGRACLVIVGEGTSKRSLQDKAAELDIGECVLFAGWIDQDFVPNIIAAADICLVPHMVTEHIDTTIPNKIYDYMAQARPVLVTHSRSLKGIVERYNCGYSYRDHDHVALAGLIGKLADDVQRNRMGEHGRSAVYERLNWEIESVKLIRFMNEWMATTGTVTT